MASFEKLEADHFPASRLPYDLFVPVPKDLGNDRPFNACKLQFSAINGGTIITFAMSHSVADGSGTNELIRVLSKETRLAQERSHGGYANEARSIVWTTGMGLDRRFLRNITSAIAFNIKDHPACSGKAAPPTNSLASESARAHPFATKSPEVPVLLRISSDSLAQLKTDAMTPGASPISTHDALSALRWRTVLLIRSQRSASAQNLPASISGSIFMPSDARRHLDLPSSYIGNAVYQLTADLDLGTRLSPSGLQHAASAIRRAIISVTSALVASNMAQLKRQWIDWGFLGAASTTGVAMGTDWTSSSLYNDDRGKVFGPLATYRYPNEAGICILPKLLDGTAEVIVSVMPQEVDLLKGKEGFGKSIERH